MEDDSDTEMADYGTDFSDNVTETLMHWQVPTSATSNLAQSREADDSHRGSCMFPLSDPE